jgi:hypothetical protein
LWYNYIWSVWRYQRDLGRRGRDRMVVGFTTTYAIKAITTNVVSSNPIRRGVLNATLCDTVCQWLAACWWFSPGRPVSSTNKIEILLKVTLNTITFNPNPKKRSEYDKGRFWPNLRNCLYRYNIKHNHWKVRKINFLMISLCPLLLSNVNGGGSN